MNAFDAKLSISILGSWASQDQGCWFMRSSANSSKGWETGEPLDLKFKITSVKKSSSSGGDYRSSTKLKDDSCAICGSRDRGGMWLEIVRLQILYFYMCYVSS